MQNFFTDAPLTVKQLDRLKEHKYASQGKSLMEPPLHNFWNWVVEKLPLWLAPNLITLIGLAFNGASFLMLLFYRSNNGSASSSIYFFNAISLFVYQTLDAVDGKQARRTKSSSPLGELFDHGCDSLSTIFVSISVALTVGAAQNEPFYFAVFVVLCSYTFYCSHWVTYVTGSLHFGSIDVTEAQYGSILIFILTSVFGEEFWSYRFLFGYPLRYIIYFSLISSLLFMWPRYLELGTTQGAGMNGATVANTSIISPIQPIGALLIVGIQVAYRTQLYYVHPFKTVLLLSVTMAKVTNRLIVAALTKSELHLWDSTMCPVLTMFLNQYWGVWIPENTLLLVCLVWAIFNLVNFLCDTYKQIANHLNIKILTI